MVSCAWTVRSGKSAKRVVLMMANLNIFAVARWRLWTVSVGLPTHSRTWPSLSRLVHFMDVSGLGVTAIIELETYHHDGFTPKAGVPPCSRSLWSVSSDNTGGGSKGACSWTQDRLGCHPETRYNADVLLTRGLLLQCQKDGWGLVA